MLSLLARYARFLCIHVRSDRAHLRRPRARFSSVFDDLYALFVATSASFIAAIEQVRRFAEGLLNLAP